MGKTLTNAILGAFFQSTTTEVAFATVSLVYLLLVLLDLVLDELSKQGEQAGTCTNGTMVEEGEQTQWKTKVDLGFLVFFTAESLLRMAYLSVMQYLRDWANSSDFFVLIIGIMIDVWVLSAGDGATNFSFIRMVRMVRLVRIASTYSRLKKRAKLYHLKKRSLLYRASTTPKCNWGAKCQYAAFVSHNKQDAAQTARYMHGQLQLMLGADVFLDSVDLLDFRDLFAFHLETSEVLICLASPLFFHSTWCLLEIFEAHIRQVPVLLIGMPDWKPAVSLQFLRNLEQELQATQPKALGVLRSHLTTWSEPATKDSQGTTRRETSEKPGTRPGLERQGSFHAQSLRSVTRKARSEQQLSDQASRREQIRNAPKSEQISMLADIVIKTLGLDDLVLKLEQATAEAYEDDEVNLAALQSEAGLLSIDSAFASNHKLLATLKTLVNGMAVATGRKALEWRSMDDEIKRLMDQKEIVGNAQRACCQMLRNLACMKPLPPTDQYKAFIVLDVADAEAQSAMQYLLPAMQRELKGTVVAQTFHGPAGNDLFVQAVQSPADRDSAEQTMLALEDGVHRSGSVLLLLTKDVLRRPTTLLLIFEAITSGKPVICLFISGGGYDFYDGKELLTTLRRSLERVRPGLYHEVRTHLHVKGHSFSDFENALTHNITNHKATSFDPYAPLAVKDATVHDIAMRTMAKAQLVQTAVDTGRLKEAPGLKRKNSNDRLWQLAALASSGSGACEPSEQNGPSTNVATESSSSGDGGSEKASTKGASCPTSLAQLVAQASLKSRSSQVLDTDEVLDVESGQRSEYGAPTIDAIETTSTSASRDDKASPTGASCPAALTPLVGQAPLSRSHSQAQEVSDFEFGERDDGGSSTRGTLEEPMEEQPLATLPGPVPRQP